MAKRKKKHIKKRQNGGFFLFWSIIGIFVLSMLLISVWGISFALKTGSSDYKEKKVPYKKIIHTNSIINLPAIKEDPDKGVPPLFIKKNYQTHKREIFPMVAIVIDDVGNNMETVYAAESLPEHSIAFSIIPNLSCSYEAAIYLHKWGFPVMVHLPMEPEDIDRWPILPGTLHENMSSEEISNILNDAIESVPYAVGVNNHMGSSATKSYRLMMNLMSELKKRGLFFLDSKTTKDTIAFQAAKDSQVPSCIRNVFLDDEDNVSYIERQMDILVSQAYEHGYSIGIGHMRMNTILALKKTIPEWEKTGVRFVSIGKVVE